MREREKGDAGYPLVLTSGCIFLQGIQRKRERERERIEKEKSVREKEKERKRRCRLSPGIDFEIHIFSRNTHTERGTEGEGERD